jgi:hypothetical protein
MMTRLIITVCLIGSAAVAWGRWPGSSGAVTEIASGEAATLRGGARCEYPTGLHSCDQCGSGFKCTSMGNKYGCANVLTGPCIECFVWNEQQCGGDLEQYWDQDCQYLYGVTFGGCTRVKNDVSSHDCGGTCP